MTSTDTIPEASEVRRTANEVSNWGRWGAEDERGALNLITPETRLAATRLVRDGMAVSCALPLPVTPAPDNPSPVQHHVTRGGDAPDIPHIPGLSTSADYFAIASHGMATTHLDALCHIFVDGKMYNGFDQTEVRTTGAARNSIMSAADGIVGRGVLLDIPAVRGVPWLEPGTPVHPDDLDAAERLQGVRVRSGDILLVATGRDARRAEHGAWAPAALGLAGLQSRCLPWLRERDIAILGSDGVSDVTPSHIPGWPMPIHQVAIVFMGVHLIDNMDLSRLLRACRDRGRWEFLFTLAPLRLERGTASPVNPVAML